MDKPIKITLQVECSIEIFMLKDKKFLLVDHTGATRVADDLEGVIANVKRAFEERLKSGS